MRTHGPKGGAQDVRNKCQLLRIHALAELVHPCTSTQIDSV